MSLSVGDTPRYKMESHKNRPKIITLCGSSRFVDVMAVVGWLLERDEGAITMGLHLLKENPETKEKEE